MTTFWMWGFITMAIALAVIAVSATIWFMKQCSKMIEAMKKEPDNKVTKN